MLESTTKEVSLQYWQGAALLNPFTHFCMYGGVGVGKSFTGSHFAINQIRSRPAGEVGLVGANTYDQLSQATLKELFKWFDAYGIEYVIDCQPPKHWNAVRKFKEYRNILSVREGKKVSHALTRVLSDGDAIRGVELAWYWLDELRDTEQYAHDMVLGRMRGSKNPKGLCTTTTNGEGWDFTRFGRARRGQHLYGSLHVKTLKSVEAGILTQQYYDALRATYSELMAAQELDCEHVNVFGGKCYYAAGDHNRKRTAPWGDTYPSRDRNLIIGCDFNFSPAPCTWMIGQIGPEMWGPGGEYFGECIHWFGELSEVGISTPEMTFKLLTQYPDFFYEIYGDMSGNIGTTSNAGKTDFDQIGAVLSDNNCLYTISVEQMDEDEAKVNPRVRARVENMNAMFKNAVGEIRQTYDPESCPLFDGDVKMVGWKNTMDGGRGKLDSGGDVKRTHATDGAGYAVYKKFPPVSRASIVESIPSSIREEM
jgi:hypothetical protein